VPRLVAFVSAIAHTILFEGLLTRAINGAMNGAMLVFTPTHGGFNDCAQHKS